MPRNRSTQSRRPLRAFHSIGRFTSVGKWKALLNGLAANPTPLRNDQSGERIKNVVAPPVRREGDVAYGCTFCSSLENLAAHRIGRWRQPTVVR